MPPRKPKTPSKDSIKRAADRAEGKAAPKDYDPLKPDDISELPEVEDLEQLPGGVVLPRPKTKRGRPVYKYNAQYVKVAAAMVSKGATSAEIADAFGVSTKTIWMWRQTYDEFDTAFKELGNAYDARMERTLAERAAGYEVDDVMIFQNKGIPVIVPYRKQILPDVGALKHWLAIRQPDKWRVKEEVEITTDGEAFMKIWQTMGGKKDGLKE